MCNEFNSGLFPSYIWDSFKAEHRAETIRGRGRNEGLFFICWKSWTKVRLQLSILWTSVALPQACVFVFLYIKWAFSAGRNNTKLWTVVQIVQLFQELVTLQEKAPLWRRKKKTQNKANCDHKATSAVVWRAWACEKTRKDTARGEMARTQKWRSAARAANQLAGACGVLARGERDAARKNPPVGRSGGAMASTSRLGGKSAFTRAHGTTTPLPPVRRTPCGARGDFSQ